MLLVAFINSLSLSSLSYIAVNIVIFTYSCGGDFRHHKSRLLPADDDEVESEPLLQAQQGQDRLRLVHVRR